MAELGLLIQACRRQSYRENDGFSSPSASISDDVSIVFRSTSTDI